jgi:hypothetical protein
MSIKIESETSMTETRWNEAENGSWIYIYYIYVGHGSWIYIYECFPIAMDRARKGYLYSPHLSFPSARPLARIKGARSLLSTLLVCSHVLCVAGDCYRSFFCPEFDHTEGCFPGE